MRDTHLLSGLKQLRGESLGRLADIDKQLEVLEAQRETEMEALRDIDKVLRRQAPEFALETIKARRPKGSRISTRKDGRRVPVTRAITNLLHLRNVAMSVDDVVECLAGDYPSMDIEKLKQNVRMCLSTKRTKGVLQAATNDKGLLAYSFAPRPAAGSLKKAA